MRIGDISYRIKVPLILVLAILVTSIVVTLALTWRAYSDLREEVFNNAVEVGSILSNSLPKTMLHDDLWAAYSLIQSEEGWYGKESSRLLVVLDNDGLIYVSNRPKELVVTTSLGSYNAELARVKAEVFRLTGDLSPHQYEHPDDRRFYVIYPMLSDGVAVGTLIIGYDRSLFWPRFKAIVERVVISAVIVTILLLAFGWYLGNSIVAPLGQLTRCMSRVGREKPGNIECNLFQSEDEIGQLGVTFQKMLNELNEKEQLENNMIASERLAAIGRLAAGIAHEINNPLGGMLNAMNTFNRYSKTDDIGRETFALIERGLTQIHETVSAMLVEANPRSHDLISKDIDDVCTLLLPDAHQKHVHLEWNNEVKRKIPLPSTPIRQILINLVLNAIHATFEGGAVRCTVADNNGSLLLHVENDGEKINDDCLSHLFEPFSGGVKGNGLGLWVTYQLVNQLGGDIKVLSLDEITCFEVELPTMGVI